MFFGLDWKIGNDAKRYEKAKKWYIRKLNKKSLNTYLSDPSLRYLPILRIVAHSTGRKSLDDLRV